MGETHFVILGPSRIITLHYVRKGRINWKAVLGYNQVWPAFELFSRSIFSSDPFSLMDVADVGVLTLIF